MKVRNNKTGEVYEVADAKKLIERFPGVFSQEMSAPEPPEVKAIKKPDIENKVVNKNSK